MAKRWTEQEDQFLHAYYDGLGDYVGTHDLGRPAGAATKRVAFLKRSGAWDALTRSAKAAEDYRRAVGRRVVED